MKKGRLIKRDIGREKERREIERRGKKERQKEIEILMNIGENCSSFHFFLFSTVQFLLLYPFRSVYFPFMSLLRPFFFNFFNLPFLFSLFLLFSFLFSHFFLFILSSPLSIYLPSLQYTHQFILNAKIRAYKINKSKKYIPSVAFL